MFSDVDFLVFDLIEGEPKGKAQIVNDHTPTKDCRFGVMED